MPIDQSDAISSRAHLVRNLIGLSPVLVPATLGVLLFNGSLQIAGGEKDLIYFIVCAIWAVAYVGSYAVLRQRLAILWQRMAVAAVLATSTLAGAIAFLLMLQPTSVS